MGHVIFCVVGKVGEHINEFVATDPGKGVTFANHFRKTAGNFNQGYIAIFMPKLIVNRLEAIRSASNRRFGKPVKASW